MFAGLPVEAAARQARLKNRVEGLAASLRSCGTGSQENLWPRLGEISCPVQLVHGSADAKFADIAQDMAADLPSCHVVAVDGTHAVHLEQPEQVALEVAEFVDRHRL